MRDIRSALKKLLDEADNLQGRSKDVSVLSDNVVEHLGDMSETAKAEVRESAAALQEKYGALVKDLKERLDRVTGEMGNLESVDKAATELLDKLKRLQREMAEDANPWGRDEEATRRSLEGLRGQLEGHFGKGRELNNATRKKYAEYGQSLPSETAQRLSAVEILGETLVSEMDEKARGRSEIMTSYITYEI